MLKTRTETWVAAGVVLIGLIPAALAGLWGYMSATATPLHPTPDGAPSVSRSSPTAPWTDAVAQSQRVVRAALTEQNLPGLSVAVGVGRDIVWAEGFGFANLETRTPVGPETTFRAGTVSTLLTSAAVGLLLEEGKLTLDSAIERWVPAVPEPQRSVTLRQLMAHVAGVPNDGGDEGPLYSAHCQQPSEAFQYLSGYERERRFEPGTQFAYSSYGWIMVSAAVEAAANEPFLAFMEKRIFAPLGMRETAADSAPTSHQATAYFPRFAADPRYGPDPMRPVDYSCYAGAGVFQSTPSDLVRFGIAIAGGTLLKPATVQLLQSSQRLASGQDTGWGLGWHMESVTLDGAETQSVGHHGTSLGGTVASLVSIPDRSLVVAVMSNISYADTPGIATKIANAFAIPARQYDRTAPSHP